MGTGKTTVGAALAQRLERQFLDNDVLLERRTGKTAAELRRGLGENALHHVEAEVLLTCLAVRPVAVIAAAASTIDNRKVREALRVSAFVVWLRTDVHVLSKRLSHSDHRPIPGDATDVVARQDRKRRTRYASVADVKLDTTGRTGLEATDDLMRRIRA